MDITILLEEVFEAYYECRKNKRKTANALLFEFNYEYNCVKLWKEINDGTYDIGRSICFIVTRPKLREVFAADFRDRIVHHLLIRKLEPLFELEFIYDSYNCRKNKGTLFGIKRLHKAVKYCSNHYTQSCYIAKFDFQGFFMSIHKPTLWAMLKEFIEDRYKGNDIDLVLQLTKQIVLHCPSEKCFMRSPAYMWAGLAKNKSLFTTGKDYGLPIGNLTSLMFANFYLSRLDHILRDVFAYYGRYVDDFFIVCRYKYQILYMIPTIKKIIEPLQITLHPKKLYIQRYEKGCSFIGGLVKGPLIYTTNRTVSHFIEAIHRFNKLAEQDPEYPKKNAEKFISVMNSYFGFLKHYKAYAIKRKLVNRISKRWWEVFYILGHFDKFVCKNKYKLIRNIKLKVKNKEFVW